MFDRWARIRGPAALLKPTASPLEYFQLFFDDKTLGILVENSQKYAVLSGVGTERRYPNVDPNFMDRSRLMRNMAILMRHGLRPSPQFKSSFQPESGFVHGDNRLEQIFKEYGWLEWQCFRSFFHISDPRKHDFQRVYMDNLYLSVKVAQLAKEKVTRKLLTALK